MRHPLLDFRIPPRFVALLDWLLEGYDRETGLDLDRHVQPKLAGCVYEISAFLLAARAGLPTEGWRPDLELSYDNHPLEVIPFARNCGDGLVYAWALLAPELDLDELPCVSFAPVDQRAVWLGDDVKSALETMLIGWNIDCASFVDEHRRAELCTALGLTPDFNRTDVTAGARTKRLLTPPVPDGWRFEATSDGIGVLAPSSAFASGPFDGSSMEDEATTLSLARSLLERGQPASALVALKEGYFEDTPSPIVRMQREAFLALGRPALAARATRWLEYQAEFARSEPDRA